jgi:hypothetical protein
MLKHFAGSNNCCYFLFFFAGASLAWFRYSSNSDGEGCQVSFFGFSANVFSGQSSEDFLRLWITPDWDLRATVVFAISTSYAAPLHTIYWKKANKLIKSSMGTQVKTV